MNESRLPSNDHDDEASDIVDTALRAMAADVPNADPPPELLASTRAAIESASITATNNITFTTDSDQFTTSPSPAPQTKSRLMKAFSATLGVLATTALVFVLAAILQNPNSAFAEVMARIGSAQMMSFHRVLITEDHPRGIKIFEYETADGRRRSEQGSTVSVFKANHFIDFTLLKGTKTVLYPANRDGSRNSFRPQRNFIEELQQLQRRTEEPDEVLPAKIIDGEEAVGYVLNDNSAVSMNRYTLWITPVSNKLMSVVHESEYEGRKTTRTLTGFRFFDEIDESLFAVPSDYKRHVPPEVPIGETRTVAALRAFARYNDGAFPESLTDMSVWLDTFQTAKTGGFGNRDANSAIRAITQTIILLSRTAPDDYGYHGAGRFLGDGDTIIFWYRNEEGTSRAIFDDLSTRAVSDDEIAAIATE